MFRYAKALVAMLAASLTAAQTAIPMPAAAHGWVTVALAGVAALGVWAVPNAAPAEPEAVRALKATRR